MTNTPRRLMTWTLLLLAGLAPAAAESVDRTVPADPDATVEIENVAGQLRIVGWGRNEVRVVGHLGDDVEELIVEGRGSRISIEVEIPEGGRSWRRRDIDAVLEISVPTGAQVEAETISASIRVEGVRGRLELSSVSGSVEVEGAADRADLESVSGSIRLRGERVSVGAESVSGSIDLEGVAGRVEATSVSGRVRVRADEVDRVDLESVSGSIDFEGSLGPSARLEVSSHSGNVELRLPASTSADFELSTFSGGIDNDFGPAAERESRWVPAKSVEFRTGSGGARVVAETFSGSVNLRKR